MTQRHTEKLLQLFGPEPSTVVASEVEHRSVFDITSTSVAAALTATKGMRREESPPAALGSPSQLPPNSVREQAVWGQNSLWCNLGVET